MCFGTLAICSKRTDRKNLSEVKRTLDERPTSANDLVTRQHYTETVIADIDEVIRYRRLLSEEMVRTSPDFFFRAIPMQIFTQHTLWTIF